MAAQGLGDVDSALADFRRVAELQPYNKEAAEEVSHRAGPRHGGKQRRCFLLRRGNMLHCGPYLIVLRRLSSLTSHGRTPAQLESCNSILHRLTVMTAADADVLRKQQCAF